MMMCRSKRNLGLLLLGFPFCSHVLASSSTETAWRKPGLWQVAIWNDGESLMGAIKVQQCSAVNIEPDGLLSIAPGQENCVEPKVTRSSSGVLIHTICRVHSQRFVTDMEMSGNFDSAYHGSVTTSISELGSFASKGYLGGPTSSTLAPKPVKAMNSKKILYQAEWLGPCKPNMKPGDLVLSNGITVNPLLEHKVHEGR
jgi:hypothetical protein